MLFSYVINLIYIDKANKMKIAPKNPERLKIRVGLAGGARNSPNLCFELPVCFASSPFPF